MKDFPRFILVTAIIWLIAGAVAWAGSTPAEVVDFPLFPLAIIIVFIIQWIGFALAIVLHTEAFFDLTGSLTYFLVTLGLVALSDSVSLPRILLAATVSIWAVRLGTFLAWRVRASGGDDRFDEIKTNPPRFFLVWNIQALWVTVTASAAWMALSGPGTLPWSTTLIGGAVWLIGFAIEVIADNQKSSFKAAHPHDFMTSGLWSLSRHPNYVGEIVLWVGVAIMAAPALSGGRLIGLISPVFVFILLRFVSGIPLLEKKAEQRWGDNPHYREYRDRTPLLFPRPFGG
ncbi:MAG: DUF1295 domain-containing protein [Flaviflexus sp.]|nr:DUF1295 domain-containing protein [Flaviflexus sp.]